ncbi:MAG TPA: DUF2255 family protein [Bacteroidota bacterium]|nr:DUF2255 family protein [Bacteroidota bacterium]
MNRFPIRILDAVRHSLVIGIRAGTQPHRIIAVWAVVVQSRVFVRSWSVKPKGWHRAFLKNPRGILQVAGRKFAVRAILTRSERLRDAVDQAYREKYNTPGSSKYVRDLARPKSRATTTELMPS